MNSDLSNYFLLQFWENVSVVDGFPAPEACHYPVDMIDIDRQLIPSFGR